MSELREEFFRYVEAHPAWDKRIKSLVVTDAKETSIQLRALVSASDPDKLGTLRCEVREALISYVQFPKYYKFLQHNTRESHKASRSCVIAGGVRGIVMKGSQLVGLKAA